MPDDDRTNDDRPGAPDEEEARPVAVAPGSSAPWGEWGDAGAPEPAQPEAPALPSAENVRPGIELAVAAACAVLAASVFFPWYSTFTHTASGWASGGWAPAVFALGVLGVATVALRRLKVAVEFPVHHALVLEGIGWVAVVFVFVKRQFAPRINDVEMAVNNTGVLLALFSAVAVALLGGMVSKGEPFVLRPGWLRSTGGRIGAGMLAAVVAVGAFFGLANSAEMPAPAAPQQRSGYAPCLSDADVPIPDGVEAAGYTENTTQALPVCFGQLTSTLALRDLGAAYRSSLNDAGWEVLFYDPQKTNIRLQALKGSDCLSVTATAVKPKAGTDKAITALLYPDGEQFCQLAAKDAIQKSPTP